MRLLAHAAAILCLAARSVRPAAADEVPSWDVTEAVSIARDAYVYGYPLVTFDMVRQQQTNVATPDAEHAPMGQLIKMKGMDPAVDNLTAGAVLVAEEGHALHRSWLDASRRSHGSSRSEEWAAATASCRCWTARLCVCGRENSHQERP